MQLWWWFCLTQEYRLGMTLCKHAHANKSSNRGRNIIILTIERQTLNNRGRCQINIFWRFPTQGYNFELLSLIYEDVTIIHLVFAAHCFIKDFFISTFTNTKFYKNSEVLDRLHTCVKFSNLEIRLLIGFFCISRTIQFG